jgi:predicted protein tyrosine phosphatase
MIYVSSLNALGQTAAKLASFDLLTLLSPAHAQEFSNSLACERHVRLTFHDIVEPVPGLIAPDSNIMRDIVNFGRSTRQDRAMLVHCWAGISRSSAAAFSILCDRNPGFENEIAAELRRRSSSVTPNRLMVALADDLLDRNGHMVEAIDRIGRGAEAAEGEPYEMPLTWPI